MTTLRVLPGDVAWLPWSREAFARAHAERKPVLLAITTTWSESCREMDRTSYADRAVAFAINDGFVPVRVDADRRPDISDRYTLGGWPTTVFLTPDGEVLGGGTYVDADRMPAVLERVRTAFQHGDVPPDAPPAPPPVRGDVVLDPVALSARIFDLFDEEHGGFGTVPKFPHTAPLQLALAMYRQAPTPRLETIVTRTLDAMGWGGLYDEEGGGFFRVAAGADWQDPRREKTLEVNAALARLYVDAAETLDVARFAERASDVLRYAQHDLADGQDGGWYGSHDRGGAFEDRPLYADTNAAMASACLAAARAFDDEWLRDFALKSLERVLLACYAPGKGVAHYWAGRAQVRGLLVDQVAMASAQLDAFETTGNVVYEMMAEELAHYAIRELWDEQGGGFFDRSREDAGDLVGRLRTPLKPFVGNCDAARLLKRLAATSGNGDFAQFANGALQAVAAEAVRQGPLAAHYVLAAL